jgi:hypothetical protein
MTISTLTTTDAANLNTVLNGDCVQIMRQMQSDSVDFVITDPPYICGGAQWWSTRREIKDHFGVFVGAGFAPAAARLHPEDRGRDAGALVFECRFAGAAANSVEQKVSDLWVGPGGTRVELGSAMQPPHSDYGYG